jgi:hypothetical protein
MPKGAELHTHYSSTIDYDYILDDIEKNWEDGKYRK